MRTYSSETASGLLSKGLEGASETPGQAIVKSEDLLADMILKALEDPSLIDELPEDLEEIQEVLLAAVMHAQKDDSPEVRACVSKKIPIIIEDHPEWDRKQQIAVAFAMCRENPKAYEKSAVADEEDEIEQLTGYLANAEARGDEVAAAGIRYALGMAEAARDIAEDEEKTKINAQEAARFGPKGMGKAKDVKKAGAAPKAAIQAAAAQWEEEKHPRAKGGKFTSGSGQKGAAPPQQAQKPAAQAPPGQAPAPALAAPQKPTAPAGRLQQVDMDRVKGAVETARQALAARVQEAMKKPAPPEKKPEAGMQTIRPGHPGYEEMQAEARAARGEAGKEPKAEAKPEQPKRGSDQPYKNLQEFKDTMKRAVAAGLKRDKIKQFMSLPRAKREEYLQRAEGRKGTGTQVWKPKPKAEAPKKVEEKKPAAAPKAPEKKEPPKAAPKPEPKPEIKKPEPKPEKKPVPPPEKKEPPKPEAKKEPEKKSEPRRPSVGQELARYQEEEKKRKAKAGKKDEPSETQAARKKAAEQRKKEPGKRDIAFPAGYKFDENPVAIIERSLSILIKGGTSEGAKKGWETRRGKAPASEEKPEPQKRSLGQVRDEQRSLLQGIVDGKYKTSDVPHLALAAQKAGNARAVLAAIKVAQKMKMPKNVIAAMRMGLSEMGYDKSGNPKPPKPEPSPEERKKKEAQERLRQAAEAWEPERQRRMGRQIPSRRYGQEPEKDLSSDAEVLKSLSELLILNFGW